MEKILQEGERLDDLQNGYSLIQNPQQFCFGIDGDGYRNRPHFTESKISKGRAFYRA